MVRCSAKAIKSKANWTMKKTSPKPKVVPTSNGKKKDDGIISAVKPVVLSWDKVVQRDEQLRHFAWLYPIWLDCDGPVGIEGTELEVEDFVDHKDALDYFVGTEVLYRTDEDDLFEWADDDNIKHWLMSHMSDNELHQFCADHDDISMVEDIRYEKGWDDEEDEDDEERHKSLDEFDNVVYSYLDSMVNAKSIKGASRVFFQFPKDDYPQELTEAVRRFKAGEYKKKKQPKKKKKVEDDEDYSMSEDEDEESSSDEEDEEEEESTVVTAPTTVYYDTRYYDDEGRIQQQLNPRIQQRIQQQLNMLNGGTGGTVEEYLAHAAAHGANHGDSNPQDQPH